jgi:outer membrane murein-binding lipoprotein Lpp
MKYRNRTAVLALAVMALVITGCASSNANNDYAAATIQYNAAAAQYATDGNAISAARAAGRVTDLQWAQFVVIQGEVRAADSNAFADLTTWKATGTQPTTYAAHAASLATAHAKATALAGGVK